MSVRITVQRTGPVTVPLPAYQTDGAAGMDLNAALAQPVTLGPGQRRLIPTGLRLELPGGYEGQVRPRSGLALRHGITVLNAPGTVDADYRGEVGVVLINLGEEPFTVRPLDRIAQLVVVAVERAEVVQASALSETVRGQGGYGSTGSDADGS